MVSLLFQQFSHAQLSRHPCYSSGTKMSAVKQQTPGRRRHRGSASWTAPRMKPAPLTPGPPAAANPSAAVVFVYERTQAINPSQLCLIL